AINLTFTHLSAAIEFKDLVDGDKINIPALKITESTERIFYFTPPAGGKLSGTAADKPFTIDLGTSPVGKLHYVKVAHQGGTTTPGVLVETNRFLAWRNSTNVLTTNFTLQCDIDLTGVNWEPIGGGLAPYTGNIISYTGTFDGGGHTIYGLKITATDSHKGLFGHTYGAVLANVTIKDPVISVTGAGSLCTAALVGYALNTTISHCAVVGGTVTGNARVGGLVGWADNTHIAGCYTAGTTVKGNHNVGGLVGHTNYNTHIAACYATDVTVTGSNSGGLVGSSDGTIAFCYTNHDKLLGHGTSLAGTCYDGLNPASDALKNYTGDPVPVNVWNNATDGVKEITLTKDIWKTDFTLDMSKLK
ncbi:hypothetical protein LJC05_03585, partial [Bacteroides sp. OttesenSCG-928-J23]|nr:hypothetical protein [Bacteroides sp. OttesenSCG-928-J23]